MTAPWWDLPLIGFDTETTGVDVENDRIVTASLVLVEPDGTVAESHDWLINPGIPISDRATAVHGVTNEHAQQHGMSAPHAIATLTTTLRHLQEAHPLAGFNVAFDLTMLDRECRRYGIEPFDPNPVIDAYVLDKQVDRYRRGGRKLTDVAAHYGVQLDAAHTADADALAAVLVARAIGRGEPHPPADARALHLAQVAWRRQQQESLAAYFASQGKPADVDPTWPVHPVRDSVGVHS